MMSRIDSRHWTISTVRHFQNGHHNTAKIDSIRNIIIYPHIKLWWYRTMLIFCDIVATHRNCSMSGNHLGHHYSWIDSRHWTISNGRHFQNGHHNTTQIQHCSISTPFHMWVDYDVLKRATSRNCSMSGLNSEHHYLPTYQIVMISDNVDILRYCGDP
jgi:hypothetical protein